MRQAQLGNKKRLISDNAKQYNRNLRGRKETLKQSSWESTLQKIVDTKILKKLKNKIEAT